MKIRNNNELIEFINQGNRAKYVFFWGHQKSKSGITKSCFSQWYESSFEIDGIHYPTAEHYMMAEKARLFGDNEITLKIAAAKNPGEAKKYGREVKKFNEQIWIKNRFAIVVNGNKAKFSQNQDLKQFLLNTKDRVLVEASPVDKIWGIGLASDDPVIEDPNHWKGLNLLGYALMEVRDLIINIST